MIWCCFEYRKALLLSLFSVISSSQCFSLDWTEDQNYFVFPTLFAFSQETFLCSSAMDMQHSALSLPTEGIDMYWNCELSLFVRDYYSCANAAFYLKAAKRMLHPHQPKNWRWWKWCLADWVKHNRYIGQLGRTLHMWIHRSVFPPFDKHLLVRCFYYLLRQKFGSKHQSENIRGNMIFICTEQRLWEQCNISHWNGNKGKMRLYIGWSKCTCIFAWGFFFFLFAFHFVLLC